MQPSKLLTLICAVGLGAGTLLAQEDGRVEGKVLIPDTSIERREDVGVRAHTNHRILLEPAGGLGPAGGMTPLQIRSFYGMPSTGGHDVIVIIDAYDYPTALPDFNTFASQFGLPLESSTNPTASTNKVFQVVYAGGTKPAGNGGWNQEAALDIEWAHALAPSAKIVLVEAKSNQNADLYAAVDVAAAIVGAKQVSMSWGGSESSGETAYDVHFNKTGPLFFASAGDAGGKVIYPSCSQYVIAIGGTSVATNSGGTWTGESAWASGGGGNSAYVPKPTWQAGVSMTGANRGVPDISSDADPNTGVCVYDSTAYKGIKGWMVFGGTSVSSPCMAGMVNVTGLSFTSTTQFLTTLYSNFLNTPTVFRDITTGNNGFPALPGWDYATGVGTPLGASSF
jgi:subtilase family serine protease